MEAGVQAHTPTSATGKPLLGLCNPAWPTVHSRQPCLRMASVCEHMAALSEAGGKHREVLE